MKDYPQEHLPKKLSSLLEKGIKSLSTIIIDDISLIENTNNDTLPTREGLLNDQKMLAMRSWKQMLISQDISDIIDLVHEISSTDDKYIKNIFRPLLMDSLDQKTIKSTLSIIHMAYSTKLPPKDETGTIASRFKSEHLDDFTQKKARIKEQLSNLYSQKILDGKLIFGLGILLMNEEKENYPQFSAGDFWGDIKKRLYTGESIHESFWNTVTGDSAPAKESVIASGSNDITETISSK